MKKFLYFTAIACILTLNACGSGSKNDKETLTEDSTKSDTMTTKSQTAVNATPQQLEGIQKALDAYIQAAIKGNSEIAKPAFSGTATISHYEDGKLLSGPIQELYDYYDQTGPHHAEYIITAAEVAEDVAIVRIDSKFGDASFDDMFTLVKDGNDWKIVSKVFHVK